MTMNTINDAKIFAIAKGLAAAAMLAALPAVAGAASPDFVVLDNPGDPNFNQLLGINDSRIIVGYFGDGAVIANNGYVLVPRNHYSAENFTHLPAGDSASQTQAIGINNSSRFPKIVGFYTDSNTGFTHGFLDTNGVQVTVDDPAGSAPNVPMPVQNLLGVNDAHQAAGFWMDSNGNEHGFVVNFNSSATELSFAEISPSLFKGAVATQASNINNYHVVCGFWTDNNKISHGFYGELNRHYTTFDVEIDRVKAMSTQAFGCNDNGDIVGQFTDANGELHGFIYHDGRFRQFDAPGSSQVPVFGVQGTLINGIDGLGDIVGFFSDGKSNVNGFVEYSGD
jgi:probable HAF family extracellular repeat protein